MLKVNEQLTEQHGITHLLTDDGIVNIHHILAIDITNIETGTIIVTTPLLICQSTNIDHNYVNTTSSSCKDYTVSGFAALELVWLLKPSALEGKRLTWQKNSWIIHNLIAHPLMQLLALVGLYKQAIWIHDITVPKPIGLK